MTYRGRNCLCLWSVGTLHFFWLVKVGKTHWRFKLKTCVFCWFLFSSIAGKILTCTSQQNPSRNCCDLGTCYFFFGAGHSTPRRHPRQPNDSNAQQWDSKPGMYVVWRWPSCLMCLIKRFDGTNRHHPPTFSSAILCYTINNIPSNHQDHPRTSLKSCTCT